MDSTSSATSRCSQSTMQASISIVPVLADAFGILAIFMLSYLIPPEHSCQSIKSHDLSHIKLDISIPKGTGRVRRVPKVDFVAQEVPVPFLQETIGGKRSKDGAL